MQPATSRDRATMSLASPVSQAVGDGAKRRFLANLEKIDVMENDKGV